MKINIYLLISFLILGLNSYSQQNTNYQYNRTANPRNLSLAELNQIPPSTERQHAKGMGLTSEQTDIYSKIIQEFRDGTLNVNSLNLKLRRFFRDIFMDWSQDRFLSIKFNLSNYPTSTIDPHLWETYITQYGDYIIKNADTFTEAEKIAHYEHWLDQTTKQVILIRALKKHKSKEKFKRIYSPLEMNDPQVINQYLDSSSGLMAKVQIVGETIKDFSNNNEKAIKLIEETLAANPDQNKLDFTTLLANSFLRSEDARAYLEKPTISSSGIDFHSQQNTNYQYNRTANPRTLSVTERNQIPPTTTRQYGRGLILSIEQADTYSKIIKEFKDGAININSFNLKLRRFFRDISTDWSQDNFLSIKFNLSDYTRSTIAPHLWGTYIKQYGDYIIKNADTFTEAEKIAHYEHWLDQTTKQVILIRALKKHKSKEKFKRIYSPLEMNDPQVINQYLDSSLGLIAEVQIVGETISDFSNDTEKAMRLIQEILAAVPDENKLNFEMVLASSFLKPEDAKSYFRETLEPRIQTFPEEKKLDALDRLNGFYCGLHLQ